MSQNPYAHYPAGPVESDPMTPRTSGLAIASLVCSLIVFCPPSPLVGLILGLVALMVIRRSEGRLKGGGLAIAGVLIGVLALAAWGVAIVGIAKGTTTQAEQVMAPTYEAFRDLETGDTRRFRALLDPSLAANVKDEEILAFRDAYKATLGKSTGQPTSASAVWDAATAQDPSIFEKAQTPGSQGAAAVLMQFEKGAATVGMITDSRISTLPFFVDHVDFEGHVVNVVITPPGQAAIMLRDFIK